MKFQFTPTSLILIKVIGLVVAGVAVLIWGTSQGIGDTKADPAQMVIPGCAPSEELAALHQKAISDDATALDALKSKAGNNEDSSNETQTGESRSPLGKNQRNQLEKRITEIQLQIPLLEAETVARVASVCHSGNCFAVAE